MNETEKITLRAMTDDIDNILDRLLAFADERTEINMAIMHLTEATDNHKVGLCEARIIGCVRRGRRKKSRPQKNTKNS